jgi:lysophospholipase L1-like esterase
MPWPVYFIAGGSTFLPGVGLLMLAGVLGLLRRRRWTAYTGAAIAAVGIVLTVISAEALPIGLYAVWAMLVLAWMFCGVAKQPQAKTAVSIGMIVVTAAASGVGISYRIFRSLPRGHAPRMYVIGDSVSAPIGPHDVSTWSGLIAAQHGVQVVNLARAGAMITDETKRLQSVPLAGVVLIEIGGNDMIAKADPQKFGQDLEELARSVQGGGRSLVMLELPLFPFGNAYGLEQRRVASRYHILLVPRRYWADVLMPRDATIDGIHLTPIGHRRMADLIWEVVGEALAPKGPRQRG